MLAATRHGKRLQDHAPQCILRGTLNMLRVSQYNNMVPDMLAGFIDMLTVPLDMTNISRIKLNMVRVSQDMVAWSQTF
jgi:hypothetical protein